MKKLLISTALLGLIGLATPASADTVPSTFDENCNVNFVNGGCGGNSPAPGGGGSFTFAKPKEEKYCDPKYARN